MFYMLIGPVIKNISREKIIFALSIVDIFLYIISILSFKHLVLEYMLSNNDTRNQF